ncbi:hypothetical protein GS429_14725 [Natronorubrum sp. JWXQ-INN-674]|uniref:Uncharacterized protein n=1 Tax=Natronorubrum halalkaliphilum TaxID=2691917 RepID=A0A6B0VQD5_9EURY|nr:hypothetical protein [Natronorubrum halalkaliphilum]MXV63297.1 hypothetical protein [Natronorubrum halalkaliphilum]
MYAIDTLTDSLAVTKRYLGSLGVGGWLKVALIVFFIGGIGLPTYFFNIPFEAIGPLLDDPDALLVVLLIGAAGLAVYGVFRYLAAVLEFIFVESLRSEAIHLRRYARANLGRALWLLLFRAVLWIGLIVAIGLLVAAAFVLGDVTDPAELSSEAAAALVLSGLGVFVGWLAVYTLTTAFVVPIMLHQDRGPIGAWRRFAPVLVSNWSGLLAYLLVAWSLGFAFWMMFAIVSFVVSIFGLILFVLVTVLLGQIHSSLAVVSIGLFLLAYLAYQYVIAVFETPLRSYVRYYALLLLGDTDEALDLIPDQRAAVRSDGGSTTSAERSADHGQRETADWGAVGSARGVDTENSDAASLERPAEDSPVWEGPPIWDDLDERVEGDERSHSSESAWGSGGDDSSSWLDSDTVRDGEATAGDDADANRADADSASENTESGDIDSASKDADPGNEDQGGDRSRD